MVTKSSALIALALTGIAAQAQTRLENFDALYQALLKGQTVSIVAEYAKTELVLDGKPTPAPNATGGMKIESWEWFGKGVVRNEKAYIATSNTVLIAHPRYGHVYNYVRFRIYEDGNVEITARYLSTEKMEIVMDETFRGKISNGKDKNGVHFFTVKG